MIHIVVFQRGFVKVGRLRYDSGRAILTDARTIARWGARDKGGLIGLASHGPFKETKLHGKGGVVSCHELTVVLDILCDQEKWEKHL